jgi:DNA-binding transcriptional regulator YdaS (Cro superfamily)
MQLSTYLCGARGRLVGLASAIDMSPAYLSQIANGTRPAQAAVCVAIERATRGEVTRRDLRPCDWHLIWPELVPAAAPPTRVPMGLCDPSLE